MNTIFVYETMGRISAQMVEAARRQDWDMLVALERDVAGLRFQLSAKDAPTRLSVTERAQKLALIHRILDDDAEIRRHTEPWMQHVMRFLGGERNSIGADRPSGPGSAW